MYGVSFRNASREPRESRVTARFYTTSTRSESGCNITKKGGHGFLLTEYRQYVTLSISTFREWATDIPGECFGHLLREWEKKAGNSSNEIREFIEKECGTWATWVTNVCGQNILIVPMLQRGNST